MDETPISPRSLVITSPNKGVIPPEELAFLVPGAQMCTFRVVDDRHDYLVGVSHEDFHSAVHELRSRGYTVRYLSNIVFPDEYHVGAPCSPEGDGPIVHRTWTPMV